MPFLFLSLSQGVQQSLSYPLMGDFVNLESDLHENLADTAWPDWFNLEIRALYLSLPNGSTLLAE